MILLSLFHSQERSAIAHSYFEKIKFFKQKNHVFFYKKLMFCKEMSIFHPFLPNSKLWPAGVVNMCNPRTIWHWGFGKYHLKSSQFKRFGHGTITSFGGGRKNLFFWSGVEGWNNHLQIWKLIFFDLVFTNDMVIQNVDKIFVCA